jgi:plastocyanin
MLAATALGGCVSDRPELAGPADVVCSIPAGAFGPARAVVIIRDFAFAPETLRVAAGTAVTWASCEPPAREAHTVTAADGSWGSGLIQPGGTFEQRLDTPGAVPYTCGPHPHMHGVIIVE